MVTSGGWMVERSVESGVGRAKGRNGDGLDRGLRGWARMLFTDDRCFLYPRDPCYPRLRMFCVFRPWMGRMLWGEDA